MMRAQGPKGGTIMKKLFVLFACLSLGFILFGCASTDPLTQFIAAGEKNLNTVETFDGMSEIDDQALTKLSSEGVMLLSTSISSDQEKRDYVRTLFSEIRLQHAHNIIETEALKIGFYDLKDNAQAFQALELELTNGEKEEIMLLRQSLLYERQQMIETRGMIYELFQELQGKYNLENIDLVIENLEEILVILEDRATYISYAHQIFIDVDTILISHMS